MGAPSRCRSPWAHSVYDATVRVVAFAREGLLMLDDSASGKWEVVTWSSTYLLDLDARTITRAPDSGTGDPTGGGPVGHTRMRQDHLPVPLVRIERCQSGQPMVLTVDVRGDGVLTRRWSTPVASIRPL